MVHYLLLMLSQYSKNNKFSNIFRMLWLLHTLLCCTWNFNLQFFLVNLTAFLLTTLCIEKISLRFSSIVNMLLRIYSILIYSLFIDLMCYYLFPFCVNKIYIFQYITNGWLFNCKYLFAGLSTHVISNLLFKHIKKIQSNNPSKYLTNLNLLYNLNLF